LASGRVCSYVEQHKGSIYSNQGNYPQALEQYQKSLALSETLGDKAGIASALRGIGDCPFLPSQLHAGLGSFPEELALFEGSRG
jgi:tetratricopeptide (TPR) repeat protein